MLSTSNAKKAATVSSANRYSKLMAQGNVVNAGHWSVLETNAFMANVKDGRFEITGCVNNDGKTTTHRSVPIEPPPMLLAQTSQLAGEGNVFKTSKPGVQPAWKVTRATCKLIAKFMPGLTSDKMELLWAKKSPEIALKDVQLEFTENLKGVCRKVLRDIFYIEHVSTKERKAAASKAARAIISSREEHKGLNEMQFMQKCRADPELTKLVTEEACNQFVNGARIPGQQGIDETTGEPMPLVIVAKSKIFTIDNIELYNKALTGPLEEEFASTLENMPEVIARMKKIGPNGDSRSFNMMNFVNAALPLTHPQYHIKRPTVKLASGKIVPDYMWEPVTKVGNVEVRTYGASKLGLVFVNTAQFYGINVIIMGKHELQIFRQERRESTPMTQWETEAATGYGLSDDEDAAPVDADDHLAAALIDEARKGTASQEAAAAAADAREQAAKKSVEDKKRTHAEANEESPVAGADQAEHANKKSTTEETAPAQQSSAQTNGDGAAGGGDDDLTDAFFN